MTVIDAWAALTEGYLPTNDQLAAFITKDSSLFKFPDLSPSGKRFGKDVSELRNLFIELLKNRNGKEEVQRFIWGLELAAARQGNLTQESSAAAGTAADAASKGDKASAKEKRWVRDAAAAKSSEAVRHLRTVARILLVQPQIRYILSDAATVLAQVVAATAEETIPIAQGQMEQVSSEAPVVEVVEGDASAGSAAAVNTALDPNTTPQNAKAQMGANGLPRITPELVDAVVRDPNLKLKVPLTSSTVVDAAQMAAVARTRLAAKDKVFTAGAAKKVGHDLVSNAENVWETDGKFRAIERLRKLCVDLQRSKGWREAATFFLSEGEHALEKASSGLQKTQDKAEHLESDTFVALLDLLENFGGQGSARGILETLQSFLHKARDDAAAQEFFKLLNTLSRRALLEEAYALSKEAEDDAKRLYATLGSLNQELRSELVTLLAQVVDFAGAIAQDEYLNAFVKKLNDILLCFAKTADGGWGLNTDLWRDVTLIIVPTLVSRLGVLPIPRIMYSHPDFDFVVENIALELNHLVPKYLDVR
ncbi:hypothetical protein OC846_002885 [Tilletia horrida]|uniref:HAM1-like N-terminal domain-containing protein n=1 Tax=Tilletia horrida TaxID=155126 RepID=A0AAN6JRS0_9BASI|nr:hypothetical protein OC846_002885 [Tilletia horrida]